MGLHYPDSVKASHLNFFPIFPSMRIPLQHPLIFLSTVYKAFFDADTKACLKHWQHVSEEETAYLQIQSTKPITLGYGLTDSPVALLAWIYEKLCYWTDAYPWTDDEVLTWISIYEFSRAGPAASVQIYYEAKHPEPSEGPGKGVSMKDILTTYVPRVPIGLSHFPKEVMPLPFGLGGVCGRVVQEIKHERGGHFAAWEKPEALVGDVKKMFGKGGPCYGVVPGKNGVGTGEARKDL
jgi:microsomal epoxide hydrolase